MSKLIDHVDGCKHMICHGMSQPDTKPSQRCTGLKTLLSDHERCQEEIERGSHDVSGPWIEVLTIIPVDRLEKEGVSSEGVSVEKQVLVCGGEDRSAKDWILLCGGEDTSGTDPDPALCWKCDVSLQ